MSYSPRYLKHLLVGGLLLSSSVEAKNYLDLAQTLIETGKFRDAEVLIKEGLQENSDDRELRFLLGNFYLDQNIPKGAEKELRHALRVGMPAKITLYPLGRAYLMQGEYPRLIKELPVKADMDTTLRASLLSLHGQAYMGMNDLSRAQIALQSASVLVNRLPVVEMALARLESLQGKHHQAVTRMQAALEQDANCVECLEILGDALEQTGQQEAARGSFQAALSLDPDNSAAQFGLLGIALKSGDNAQVKALLEQVKKDHPNNPMTAYFSAASAYQQGDMASSEQHLSTALKQMPEHLPSLLLNGLLAKAGGRPDQARNQLRRVLSSSPDNLTARKTLATIELDQKRFDKVLRLLKPLMEADELGNVPADATSRALLASAYMQMGDSAKADALLDAAAAQQPGFQIQRAANRLASGDAEAGIAQLLETPAIPGSALNPDYLLTIAYLQEKQYPQALDEANKLLSSDTNNPAFHNLIGAAYQGLQDHAQARSAFEQAVKLNPDFIIGKLNLARLDLLEKQTDTARQRLLDILKTHPEHEAVLMQLAKIEAATGRRDQAMVYLQQVLEHNPHAVRAGLIMLENRLNRGEHQKALSDARQLYENNPDDPAVARILGRAQLATGSASSAQALFGKLLAAQADSVPDQFYLAEALAAGYKFKEAKQAYQKVLALDPGNLLAGLRLATLEARKGDPAKALKMLRRQSRRHFRSAEIPELIGDIHAENKQRKGNRARAHKAYQKALRLEPSARRLIKVYATRSGNEVTESDLTPIRKWLAEHPDDVPMTLFLAAELEKMGAAGVESLYESVLKRDPANVPALNNLAMLAMDQDAAIALAYAELAWQTAPEDGAVLDTYALALMANKKPGQAIPLLEKATKKLRNEPSIRFHLAQAHEAANNPKAAREQIRRLLITFPGFPERKQANDMLLRLRGKK